MPKVVIQRATGFLDRKRRIALFVDDKEEGIIHSGEVKLFELPAGAHTIKCKALWLTSEAYETNINGGQNIYLKIEAGSPLMVPLYFLMLIGLIGPILLKWMQIPRPANIQTIQLICIVPFLILLLIHVTILRKSYFKISEDTSNPFR